MKILLTNDDGIFAPGLAAIHRELARLGEVTVVAPADSQSGASHSVTISQPLVCNRVEIEGRFTGWSVKGSPADCVKLAVMQLHPEGFDMLVSGINNGANAGINIYYSGTVAAAMEGTFLQIPSVAMSLATEPTGQAGDFEKAAGYCVKILGKLMPLELGVVTNINIPQMSRGAPRGVRVVPQGRGGFEESYISQADEHGQTVFQLNGGPHRREKAPADTTSLVEGYITITALACGMTDEQGNRRLSQLEW